MITVNKMYKVYVDKVQSSDSRAMATLDVTVCSTLVLVGMSVLKIVIGV